MERIASLNWNWAGHIARITDERWTKIIVNWRPYSKRPTGRPPYRWRDDITKITKTTGKTWQQVRNRSYKLEGARGGLYPALVKNRLKKNKKKKIKISLQIAYYSKCLSSYQLKSFINRIQ